MLEEIQGRNKEKAAHEAKKVKEARDSLASLMRHSRDITEKSSFEDAQDALARKPEFKAVSLWCSLCAGEAPAACWQASNVSLTSQQGAA